MAWAYALALGWVAASLWVPNAWADTYPPPGASACLGCHSARANVQTPVPSLVGRPAIETADAMRAYKSGDRTGTIMNRIAKGFSDAEIDAIARYFAKSSPP